MYLIGRTAIPIPAQFVSGGIKTFFTAPDTICVCADPAAFFRIYPPGSGFPLFDLYVHRSAFRDWLRTLPVKSGFLNSLPLASLIASHQPDFVFRKP